jgi:hypothetical protein
MHCAIYPFGIVRLSLLFLFDSCSLVFDYWWGKHNKIIRKKGDSVSLPALWASNKKSKSFKMD